MTMIEMPVTSCSAAAARTFPIEEANTSVISNVPVNGEYFHLRVKATPVMLDAAPGQFFHLQCPSAGADAPLLRRPMSVYRVNVAEGSVEFLYKVAGAGTRSLATLRSEDLLNVVGPLGRGFELSEKLHHVMLVARGVGMATMAPLAEAAVAKGARVTALLSARSTGLVMSEEYLRSVGAHTVVVTDDTGTSAVDEVEKLVREIHARYPIDLLATCGSNRLLQIVKRLAGELHIAGQVALEQHMGCALGMCFCCVRPFRVDSTVTYKRVCCEGPVFDVNETLSW